MLRVESMVSCIALVLVLTSACGDDDDPAGDGGPARDTGRNDDARIDDAGTLEDGGGTRTDGGGGAGVVIPEGRRIDWTIAGVPGGIPSWDRVCATIDAATYGSGTTDATDAIQNAVDGCETSAPGTTPGPGVVVIPAGTYRMDGAVNVGNHGYLVIRGAGADQTTILAGGDAFNFGGNGLVAQNTPITAGAEKGSTELTLTSAAGLEVGQLIDVSADNEPGLVFTNHGSELDSKQMALITDISGNTITVTPPLIWTFAPNPVVLFSFIGLEEFAGLEDMKIDHSSGGPGVSFTFDQCRGCWARGIYSFRPGGYHTYILDSLQGEVRDCFFNDSQTYGSNNAGLNVRGTTNGGVNQGAVTAFRFENNVFEKTFPGVELQNASSGNVIAYNFGYAVQPGEFTPGDTYVGWNSGMFNDNHGPHDMMNLWEGNVGEQFVSDGYFGSGSHGTLFRNYLTGFNPRFEIAWTAVSLNRWSYHYNVVGNVLGETDPPATTYELADSASCSAGHGIYRLGYPNIGNCDFTPYDGASPTGPDTEVANTLLRWGNYDTVHDTVVFDPAEIPADVATPEARDLAASLVYADRPAWWPSDIPWPPIGPDVTGGDNAAGHAHRIPAQRCYEDHDLGDGGAFSRTLCYGP